MLTLPNWKVMTFGSRLKGARKGAGLTQKELADKLGFSHSDVSKWEKGNKHPPISSAAPICEVLGVSANYLLGMPEVEVTPEIALRVLGQAVSDLRSLMDQPARQQGRRYIDGHFPKKPPKPETDEEEEIS
jgi:transcriptional regulator with XRE-family HTH domain